MLQRPRCFVRIAGAEGRHERRIIVEAIESCRRAWEEVGVSRDPSLVDFLGASD